MRSLNRRLLNLPKLRFPILVNSSQMLFSLNRHANTYKKNPSARKKLFTESVRMDRRMLIGYARVSTQDQNLELQIEALTKAGCRKIFDDKLSGSRAERPGLTKAQEALREGDTPRRLEAGASWPQRQELGESRR